VRSSVRELAEALELLAGAVFEFSKSNYESKLHDYSLTGGNKLIPDHRTILKNVNAFPHTYNLTQ
jgi:hypothetical protein